MSYGYGIPGVLSPGAFAPTGTFTPTGRYGPVGTYAYGDPGLAVMALGGLGIPGLDAMSGFGDLGDFGAATDACAKLLAKRKAALKRMWKAPLFSKDRRAYEKLANKYGKQYHACKKAARKKARGATIKAAQARAGVGTSAAAATTKAVDAAISAAGKKYRPESVDAAVSVEAAAEGADLTDSSVTSAGAPSVSPWLIAGGVAAVAALAFAFTRGGKKGAGEDRTRVKVVGP